MRPAGGPRRRVEFSNASLDDYSFDEILGFCEDAISRKNENLFIVTLDILGAYKMLFDAKYASTVSSADVVTCDGSGLKLLSLMKYPGHVRNKVSGVDLAVRLLGLAHERGYKAAFVGAAPEIVAKLSAKVAADYPGIRNPYFHHGYFSAAEGASIAERLSREKPDILLVGMGNPVQEKFIASVSHLLKGAVMIGVGGSFDVISGSLALAPGWMRRAYLEWAFRLFQQPSRIFRMMNIPKYILFSIFYEVFKWASKR